MKTIDANYASAESQIKILVEKYIEGQDPLKTYLQRITESRSTVMSDLYSLLEEKIRTQMNKLDFNRKEMVNSMITTMNNCGCRKGALIALLNEYDDQIKKSITELAADSVNIISTHLRVIIHDCIHYRSLMRLMPAALFSIESEVFSRPL